MHRLGTQHCVAMGSPPIPGRSVRSAPDIASMTEPLVIGDLISYHDDGKGSTVPLQGREGMNEYSISCIDVREDEATGSASS